MELTDSENEMELTNSEDAMVMELTDTEDSESMGSTRKDFDKIKTTNANSSTTKVIGLPVSLSIQMVLATAASTDTAFPTLLLLFIGPRP